MATWNVRALAVKGKNGLGHAETLLLRERRSRRDIIGLQGLRRGGQWSFDGTGYTVYFSGFEKGWDVELAVAERIVEESGTYTPEPINECLLNLQPSLTGKSNRVIVYCRQRQDKIMVHAPGDCCIGTEKRPFVRPDG